MVKVTIEGSNRKEELKGNAIFAIIPKTENVHEVANMICCDGKLNKLVVANSLVDLVNNAINAVSDSKTEKAFLMGAFLDRMGDLMEQEIGKHENNNPLSDFMELLRKVAEE